MGSAAQDRISGTLSNTAIKAPCVAVATFNIPLAGLYLLGGRNLAQGDRVVVTGQSSPVDNGIYIADSGDWSRAADFDGDRDVVNGTLVVALSNGGGGMIYQVLGTNPILPGSSPITFIARVNPNATYDPTQAELNVPNLPLVNLGYRPGDLLRYGIVPNLSGAGAANAAILNTLVNAGIVNGPTGDCSLPNITGADTYYFNYGVGVASTQFRDGIRLNLNNCTVNITGTYAAGFAGLAFWNAVRDVTVKNGSVVINYPTPSAGAGSFMNIGSRYNGPAFGIYPNGILDGDMLFANGLAPQGNCVLENLRISTNCPGAQVINATGGLRNTTFRNILIDGGNQATGGIYYEFGFDSTNSQPATPSLWTTSHAQNLRFESNSVINLKTGAASFGLGANGAWGVTFEQTYVNGADVGITASPGEAFYFRPSTRDTPGISSKPWARIRGLNTLNVGAGAVLSGAAVCAPGSLMYPAISVLTGSALAAAQTDLMCFYIEDFSLNGPSGIVVSGVLFDIRNGTIRGSATASSGGIVLSDEAVRGKIDNVTIVGINGEGIRADEAGTNIWPTTRPKFLEISNCRIRGCTIGVGLNHTQSAILEGNIIGGNTLYDVSAETVQTIGVSAGAAAEGVICRNNFTSVPGGGTNYSIITGPGVIQNELNGTPVTSGNWVMQNPALTNTGFGTPTGGAIIANFPGATATLLQTSETLSQVLAILKENGVIGT